MTIPSSATSFKLYPERRYALPHEYSGALTLQLPLVDRVGTSITLEDVTGYSTSTITALTIVGGGSQTVFAVASVDIKNFIDNGCTVKLVLHSSNNWVYNVQYSRVTRGNTLGVRNTAGTLTSLNVVAATVDRVLTLPDKDINLGNLSSVATTDSNTLSGTRTRIVGGSSNTVSGTDNVVVGCTSVTTSSSLGQYIQASSGSTAGIDWPTRFIGSGTLRGTTNANTELATVITQLKAFNIYDAGSEVLTTDGGAAIASNTPKHAGACPHDDAASSVATHELDLQVVTRFSTGIYVNAGITHAKYLISVLDTAATATLVSTCSNGTVATFTVTPTVVSSRLYITVANTTGSDKPVRVRGVLKSLYSYL